MSATLARVQQLVGEGKVRISDHGSDELAADNLLITEVIAGLRDAETLEDYPDFPKGPCVLVLQYDGAVRPVHVVWASPPAMPNRPWL